jgi:hypothetical protein
MGIFKVKSVKAIDNLKEGDEIPESDYAIYSQNSFVQFEYEETNVFVKEYKATPGVFSIKKRRC